MTQYLLAVHHDYYAEQPTGSERDAVEADVMAFNETIANVMVFGGGLEAPHTATVVMVRDGQPVVTDGPFAETKEALGGFWVVDAPDLDAALEMATRASAACKAPIEVRPFQAE